ncbi:MAG: CheR family methyltransferase [Verrucomicrobiota bacterium]|nr:CheR family methyltransferase [Verrucomicrobiota bacterium]
MRFYTDTLGLSTQTFALLRDLIHERTGMIFDDAKRDLLADKLSARVVERGFSSFLDYYYLLKYDPSASEEWPRVMDALAVPETYFWREIDQIRALAEHVLPRYFEKPNPAPFRIWSAACCTGEEPLSILIMLKETGWLERAPIEVHASDASPALVARAKLGVYRERSFRALPQELRDKYFTQEGGLWRVSPDLLSRIRFSTANLLGAEVEELAAAHAIFCRNVFIYFSPESIRRVLGVFHRRMLPPGCLLVGVSESLLRFTDAFRLVEIGNAFAYIKA